MRILFFYKNQILPKKGGVQTVTLEIKTWLEDRGHEVFFLSKDQVEKNNSEKVFFLPYKKSFFSGDNISYLKFLIEDQQIDILVNQSGTEAGVVALFRASSLDIPALSVIHCSIRPSIDNFYESHMKKAKRLGIGIPFSLFQIPSIRRLNISYMMNKRKNYYKSLAEVSDHIITLTKATNDTISDLIGKDDKVLTIPNPTPQMSVDVGKKYKEIVYVGSITTTFKRVDLLVKIWELVFDQLPDWKLLIIGDGPAREELEQYVDKNNIRNISFEGVQVPGEYYQRASIFCMTSTTEGLSMSLLEAMSYGAVPVVFDSYRGVREIVEHEVNGILVPAFDIAKFASQLIRLAMDSTLRQNLALEGRKIPELYDIEKIGLKWEHLFQASLNHKITTE